MKNLLLLNMLFILLVSIIWGCQKYEMTTDTYLGDNFITTIRDDITQIQTYNSHVIPLLDKQNQQVGQLWVLNAPSGLYIKFNANENCIINNVQLWVGTDYLNVPSNNQGIPTPGKFTHKASNQPEYYFKINLSDFMTDYNELLDNDQLIYIFAHAETQNIHTNTVHSAWSAGGSFGTSRWGTFSEFMYQPPLGGGCFPHFSTCGIDFDGSFYYDNTLTGEQKKQSIYSDTGNEIGVVEYKEGKLYFRLTGNWYILDWEGVPPLTYRCYSEPGVPVSKSGFVDIDPLLSGGSMGYYAMVPESNYYLLDLKIQYCD